MSTPAPKRRRIGDASNALNRPFKSPFRTPLRPSQEQGNCLSEADVGQSRTDSAKGVASQALAAKAESPATPTTAKPPKKPLHRAHVQNKNPPFRSANSASSHNPSTARQILTLRTEIQTLTQATSLATTSTDADLGLLIDKWIAASRAAAEEVFAQTRDRVNRMGGVGAWREREKDQREWRAKIDREEREEALKAGSANEDTPEAEDYDADKEIERKEENVEAGSDDDSFTMDMMLRTLNIDVGVIGYDKVGQRWIG